MRDLLRRLFFGLGDPDFNYVIRSAPRRERNAAYLHWYVSVIPRVTRHAGFELGSGMYINTAMPEASAHFLRELKLLT
jgi:UDPglucose--hexose-1-phosphate uridylyltransferase